MSYNWMVHLVDEVTKDHDIEVRYRIEEFMKRSLDSESVSNYVCMLRACHIFALIHTVLNLAL